MKKIILIFYLFSIVACAQSNKKEENNLKSEKSEIIINEEIRYLGYTKDKETYSRLNKMLKSDKRNLSLFYAYLKGNEYILHVSSWEGKWFEVIVEKGNLKTKSEKEYSEELAKEFHKKNK